MSLPVGLVVLSACQTAMGGDIPGEGLKSLARGFLQAGARSVVSTLWKVDDSATAEFMDHFYQALLVGRLPPGAALRTAQMALQRTKAHQSPYYWAGFTLNGDWIQ